MPGPALALTAGWSLVDWLLVGVSIALVEAEDDATFAAALGAGLLTKYTFIPIAIIAIVMTVCLVVFWFATQVERLVGRTGNTVLSRLLGVLLAAMAVQFVVDGVRALLSS